MRRIERTFDKIKELATLDEESWSDRLAWAIKNKEQCQELLDKIATEENVVYKYTQSISLGINLSMHSSVKQISEGNALEANSDAIADKVLARLTEQFTSIIYRPIEPVTRPILVRKVPCGTQKVPKKHQRRQLKMNSNPRLLSNCQAADGPTSRQNNKQVKQELQEQKLQEQKLQEQKLQEQKLQEQKLQEQKLQEQKLQEQKLQEQKLQEQNRQRQQQKKKEEERQQEEKRLQEEKRQMEHKIQEEEKLKALEAPQDPMVHLIDPVMKERHFPFDMVKTWGAMEEILQSTRFHGSIYKSAVMEGRYDLTTKDGIVEARDWEKMIRPGVKIVMSMWTY
nr:kinetoplast-associated protein kap [Colletotrichum truncatum]KAF6784066.1 kinetoplast-associated protein kap [Colletotrichum truncatum]